MPRFLLPTLVLGAMIGGAALAGGAPPPLGKRLGYPPPRDIYVPAARDASQPLDIYFVDVEGGAATLIVTPLGESVLIDTGWPREDARDARRIEGVARYVAGLDRIDHVLTTHWHTDHYGGIEALAKLMPIGNFWDRGIPAVSSDGSRDFPTLIAAYKRASGGKSRALSPGDRLPLRTGAAELELRVVSGGGKVIDEHRKEAPVGCPVHRDAPAKDESDNKLSLGFLLKFQGFTYLNLGDLTWAIEHKLACPVNRVGKVDLWQVTHHGWEASGNPALVEAIKPRVAMMVNGPRKGASPSVMRTIKSSPHIEALYQLHTNVTTGAEDNTSPERIANLDEKCNGEFFRVTVSPNGSRYTVFKGANRPLQTFLTR
jgi:competence protein ComEC